MPGSNSDLRILKDIPPWEWPEGTGKVLIDTLRDDRSSKSDLLLATELAGEFTVIDDELADALLSIVRSGDKPEAVRAQAAIALGPVLDYADTEEFGPGSDVPITEPTFHRIQESLRQSYLDAGVPRDVRRRILEASVRAPQDWHADAVRAAYASDDRTWKLTAVFCMSYVPGFEEQILEALSDEDPEIEYEAVRAAGNREVAAAWAHVAALVTAPDTEKPLLLAAIESIAAIRPSEAALVLDDLADADDEDIAAAVEEAMAMASLPSDDEEEDDDDSLF
jgi:hypothetical protein